jgi:hypothetical protein
MSATPGPAKRKAVVLNVSGGSGGSGSAAATTAGGASTSSASTSTSSAPKNRKYKKVVALSDEQRELLLRKLACTDAIFELDMPGVICQSKLHFDFVKIQTALAGSYGSYAAQVNVLCDWQSTLRFASPHGPGGSAGGGGGGGDGSGGSGGSGSGGSGSSASASAGSARVAAAPPAASAQAEVDGLVRDDGKPRPMVPLLLQSLRRKMLDSLDDEACGQLLETSDAPPRFIDDMAADPFWRQTLFDFVRKCRGSSKNPFFEYVLARISMLDYDPPTELVVHADDRIFRQNLQRVMDRVPRCASLDDFTNVRQELLAFNSKFFSHFFTVMTLTSKCGGRAELGTARM